jgi:hypothetical protein
MCHYNVYICEDQGHESRSGILKACDKALNEGVFCPQNERLDNIIAKGFDCLLCIALRKEAALRQVREPDK